MQGLRFIRRVDGLTYEFARDPSTDRYPSFTRIDKPEIRCRHLPEYGWVVCNDRGEVTSRPFEDPGLGELPPEGVWVSFKGDRSYVYDAHRVDVTYAGA